MSSLCQYDFSHACLLAAIRLSLILPNPESFSIIYIHLIATWAMLVLSSIRSILQPCSLSMADCITLHLPSDNAIMRCCQTPSLCSSCRCEYCARIMHAYLLVQGLLICYLIYAMNDLTVIIFLQFAVSTEEGILMKLPMHDPVIIEERPA